MLIRKTCTGLYSSILNSYKSLSEWSLFLSDNLVIFSPFKFNLVGPELRSRAEFPHFAVTVGNLTSVSKQQPLLSLVAIPKNVGANPIKGNEGFYLWASHPV